MTNKGRVLFGWGSAGFCFHGVFSKAEFRHWDSYFHVGDVDCNFSTVDLQFVSRSSHICVEFHVMFMHLDAVPELDCVVLGP